MNRDQARNLIKSTFTRPFDKTSFRTFAINVLNRIDGSKAQGWSTQYVKDAFKPHVQRYERLGTYTSPDKETLDVLIVHLTNESKLERARTAIRNFVADHLKTRDEKDAALVAFVSPTEQQWRFSYVKMDYATVLKESGKIGVETRLTPARRFSYLVGEGESSHTAQSRFLGLLQDTQTDPQLANIEEAFSVEAVTKEFFTKYAELFEQVNKALTKLVEKDKAIRDEFMAKEVNTVDFAKKLMGQIVFLYFLQKKGWLGVDKGKEWGTGPRDFLRRLANEQYGKYYNFFNDVLELLFYDTLATDRGHEAWDERFKCRIPFLNGGLFEPLGDYDWRKTDIILPNKLFTNNEFVEEGITGTGVLDVFDRYNFTVNEAEPLEKEVAIDPEMLGKVFENLIEENRRKGLGSYYTPREIVHYMCQESLINYLVTAVNKEKQIVSRADIETFVHLGEQISHYEAVETEYPVKMLKSIEKHARLIDEKLAEITVCDPAVGSGAFTVGMMTEIVRARMALTPYFNDVHERTAYHFKRHAIQNCLYGVDIDPSAVEIAKLRLWLSLVVDEEDVKQIKPLPNLDYKIVVGNSLLGVEKNLFNVDLFNRLEDLKPLYFDESNKTKKDTYRREIDDLIHQLTHGNQTFDFEVYFSEVFHNNGGFDVMIANPPYVGEKGHKEMFRSFASGPLKRFYQGKMDVFYFFFHLALNLGREPGHVAFITTNYYITASGAKKLRQDLKSRATVTRLVNFNELKIFESALGQHNMITLLSKTSDKDVLSNNCVTKRSGFATSAILQSILSWKDKETDYSAASQWDLYDGDERYIRLGGRIAQEDESLIQRVLKKIKDQGEELEKVCNINQGIVTGADKVSKKHLEEYEIDARVGEGIFVLSKAEVTNLHLAKDEKQIVKPWFKNSNIMKYQSNISSNESIVYLDRKIDRELCKPVISSLVKYKKLLQNRREVQNQVIDWWQLQWPRNKEIFEGPKIVSPQRSKTNTFGYNEITWYAASDVFFVTQRAEEISLKYVLALLNSRLYYEWLYHKGKRKGETLELIARPLSEIPIKKILRSEQKDFIDLVDKILAAKKRDPDADTTALEREIDQLVYKLYGLTTEEIAIVEGTAK